MRVPHRLAGDQPVLWAVGVDVGVGDQPASLLRAGALVLDRWLGARPSSPDVPVAIGAHRASHPLVYLTRK